MIDTCIHSHINPHTTYSKTTYIHNRRKQQKHIQYKLNQNKQNQKHQNSQQNNPSKQIVSQLSITNTSHIKNHKHKPKKINTTSYTYHNKLLLLLSKDIKNNLGSIMNILQNHPQMHHDKYKTYFYKNTIQLKDEYQHLFEPFIPYSNQTNNNTHPHYAQFCILNNHCPQLNLLYASVFALATTPIQCKIVITPNTI
jgi:hypothetical protein